MSLKLPQVEIGIIGGSGFYKFLTEAQEIDLETDWGKPSDKITIGQIEGKPVAFLPRHGRGHVYPPHKIPYLANLAALKKLGVKYLIAPASVGSLQKEIKAGDFVISDQFFDRTRGRADTYYNGPSVVHISGTQPYCQTLRQIASECCKKLKYSYHPQGTVVVINGPRFSTAAESIWFTKMGFSVVGMTQYPEVVLAREQEIHYLNISLVTDYDVGLVAEEKLPSVEISTVLTTFKNNIERVKNLILEIIKYLPPQKFICDCQETLKKSKI